MHFTFVCFRSFAFVYPFGFLLRLVDVAFISSDFPFILFICYHFMLYTVTQASLDSGGHKMKEARQCSSHGVTYRSTHKRTFFGMSWRLTCTALHGMLSPLLCGTTKLKPSAADQATIRSFLYLWLIRNKAWRLDICQWISSPLTTNWSGILKIFEFFE